PKATVTRAQFVSFLWRADGKPESSTENTFTDLDENEYYVPAVLWAVEKQITVGTGNGKFSPDAPCLREQVVTFLYRDR
ncbi:MAG: S-layer homology domain-containing protein, partial [Candidatus Faecousia sp.]|nr:S-layer homology domain-containing protein [Candidatus Faecousia sp.]